MIPIRKAMAIPKQVKIIFKIFLIEKNIIDWLIIKNYIIYY